MSPSCPFFRDPKEKAKTPCQPYHKLAKRPSADIYARMHHAGIHTMVHEFYTHLHQGPLREMFSRRPMEESVDRSAAFFVQLCGGPQLYRQQYGEPRMRARHLPFCITESHRQIWLSTFYHVLDHPQNFSFPREHLVEFKLYLETFSKWMVNA